MHCLYSKVNNHGKKKKKKDKKIKKMQNLELGIAKRRPISHYCLPPCNKCEEKWRQGN